MFQPVQAHYLHKDSVSRDGKFFLAVIVRDTTNGTYLFATNNGPGNGLPVMGLWGRTGQARAYGPWGHISSAQSSFNKKISDKLNEGYDGRVAVVEEIDTRILDALAEAKRVWAGAAGDPPTTPVVAAPGPSVDSVTTYALLSGAFTPDLAGRILAHRQKLAADISNLNTELAGKRAEDELLALRLSSCS